VKRHLFVYLLFLFLFVFFFKSVLIIFLPYVWQVNYPRMYFLLLDTNDQNQRFSLIQELETLMKVGRNSNVVSLVGTCSFEGNLRQARAVQTTNKWNWKIHLSVWLASTKEKHQTDGGKWNKMRWIKNKKLYYHF